jgi:hypothetical protein
MRRFIIEGQRPLPKRASETAFAECQRNSMEALNAYIKGISLGKPIDMHSPTYGKSQYYSKPCEAQHGNQHWRCKAVVEQWFVRLHFGLVRTARAIAQTWLIGLLLVARWCLGTC